jgi:hypothetical protein
MNKENYYRWVSPLKKYRYFMNIRPRLSFTAVLLRGKIALWDGNGGRVILNKHRMPIEKTGWKEISDVEIYHLLYIVY